MPGDCSRRSPKSQAPRGVCSPAMCCFSAPVEYVAGTNIFARPLAGDRQALVYSMSFAAADELAMILPLPVPPGSPEDAVRFVSLEGYAHFFRDVERAFPVMLEMMARGGFGMFAQSSAPRQLVVHDVGDFEASFVPTLADFARLDPRFRLAPEVWERLPQYADWGFAVFKLRRDRRGFWARLLRRAPSKQTVHPMAFEFPRRDPSTLFFPTVHIHDGEVHEQAIFDHNLYAQGPRDDSEGWERSEQPLGAFVDSSRSAGLVDADLHCFRRNIIGMQANADQYLALT